jgi:hypothetical protein
MVDSIGETSKAILYQNIRLMQVTNTFASSEQLELSDISTAWSAPNNGRSVLTLNLSNDIQIIFFVCSERARFLSALSHVW